MTKKTTIVNIQNSCMLAGHSQRMKVPFLDLKSAYHELQDEISHSISKILSGGVYVLGDEVEAVESEWSDYGDAEFCASLGCGLDALIFALEKIYLITTSIKLLLWVMI